MSNFLLNYFIFLQFQFNFIMIIKEKKFKVILAFIIVFVINFQLNYQNQFFILIIGNFIYQLNVLKNSLFKNLIIKRMKIIF